jgi:hypothetical protein
MPAFPIIPADVFRGSGYEGIWNTIVSHYQNRPNVQIGPDSILETAPNGTFVMYRRIDADEAITWQLSSTTAEPVST